MRKLRHRGLKWPLQGCTVTSGGGGLKLGSPVPSGSLTCPFTLVSPSSCPDLWQGLCGLHASLLRDSQRHGGSRGWDTLFRLVEWREYRCPARPASPTHWTPCTWGPQNPAQVHQLPLLQCRWPAAAPWPAVVHQGQNPGATPMGPISPLQRPALPHCGALGKEELQVSGLGWGKLVGAISGGHDSIIIHLLSKSSWGGFLLWTSFVYALGTWRLISTILEEFKAPWQK